MLPRIYFETSFFGYLTSRPSRDLLKAARQQVTSDVWDLRSVNFTPYISGLVLQEAARGDVEAAKLRLAACSQAEVLEISQDAQDLARLLIHACAVPDTEPEDALHLALATLAGVDYILTWNFAHMVGPSAKAQLSKHIEKLGYKPPLIATPDDLLEELP
jgi:predicted nucleic acid-binding protein